MTRLIPKAIRRQRPVDVAAARALEDAAGRCERCEHIAGAMVAVELRRGGHQVECFNRPACDRRVRTWATEVDR